MGTQMHTRITNSGMFEIFGAMGMWWYLGVGASIQFRFSKNPCVVRLLTLDPQCKIFLMICPRCCHTNGDIIAIIEVVFFTITTKRRMKPFILCAALHWTLCEARIWILEHGERVLVITYMLPWWQWSKIRLSDYVEYGESNVLHIFQHSVWILSILNDS